MAIRAQKFETEATSSKEIESLRRQIRMLKADNARLTAEGESARSSLQSMEREVEALRNSLKEVKEGMREKISPPLRRRRRESPSRWPPLGEREGSQSAPILSEAAPLVEHDAGAFVLQQIEETLERLLSQKFRSLMEPMGDQARPIPMRTPSPPLIGGEVGPGEKGESIEIGGDVEPPPTPPLPFPRPSRRGEIGVGRGKGEMERR